MREDEDPPRDPEEPVLAELVSPGLVAVLTTLCLLSGSTPIVDEETRIGLDNDAAVGGDRAG